ncbi:MAG TPA: hypothetical protein VHB30_00570 [Solirubrobacteraceae bacterium]|jgi:hypothetical protein|nr:hypothetical protein [Solirubrobacteraceae bacterium]
MSEISDIERVAQLLPLVEHPGYRAVIGRGRDRRTVKVLLPGGWPDHPALAKRVREWLKITEKHAAAVKAYRAAEAAMCDAVDVDLKATGAALAAGKRDPGTPAQDEARDRLAEAQHHAAALQRHADGVAEDIYDWFMHDVRDAWVRAVVAELAAAREDLLEKIAAAKEAHETVRVLFAKAAAIYPEHENVPMLPVDAIAELSGRIGNRPDLLFGALTEWAHRARTRLERPGALAAPAGGEA